MSKYKSKDDVQTIPKTGKFGVPETVGVKLPLAALMCDKSLSFVETVPLFLSITY